MPHWKWSAQHGAHTISHYITPLSPLSSHYLPQHPSNSSTEVYVPPKRPWHSRTQQKQVKSQKVHKSPKLPRKSKKVMGVFVHLFSAKTPQVIPTTHHT